MSKPQRLEGWSPPSTGKTHHITLDQDQYEAARELLVRRDQAQRWANQGDVDTLEEQLKLQPWWPRDFWPGDHFELKQAPKAQVLVSLH
jgi:hypothetical protein